MHASEFSVVLSESLINTIELAVKVSGASVNSRIPTIPGNDIVPVAVNVSDCSLTVNCPA